MILVGAMLAVPPLMTENRKKVSNTDVRLLMAATSFEPMTQGVSPCAKYVTTWSAVGEEGYIGSAPERWGL